MLTCPGGLPCRPCSCWQARRAGVRAWREGAILTPPPSAPQRLDGCGAPGAAAQAQRLADRPPHSGRGPLGGAGAVWERGGHGRRAAGLPSAPQGAPAELLNDKSSNARPLRDFRNGRLCRVSAPQNSSDRADFALPCSTLQLIPRRSPLLQPSQQRRSPSLPLWTPATACTRASTRAHSPAAPVRAGPASEVAQRCHQAVREPAAPARAAEGVRHTACRPPLREAGAPA